MHYNVLVIDESGITRLELSGILKNPAVNLIALKNEIEAMNALNGNNSDIHAIVGSINSIDLKDFESVRALKGKEAYRHIPVVIVSKLTDKKYIIKAIESGAADYIVKPYDEAIVRKKFSTLLGIPSEEQAIKRPEEDFVTLSFMDAFSRELKSAGRGSHALTLILASFMPSQGSRETAVVNELADVTVKVFKTKLRETDTIFHYGNGCLAVLLPFADKEGAGVVRKKLISLFETHTMIKQKNKGYSIVLSSVSFPDDGKIKDKLLDKAEQELKNAAKASGTK